MKGSPLALEAYKNGVLSFEEKKCGLGLISSIKTNFNLFTKEQREVITSLLQRTELQTSLVSESGRFRVHFDTTGYNAPSYSSLLSPRQNAMEVAKALDSAYNFEVNYLGYLPPPNDNGNGGDNLLDIYLLTIGPGYYGSTYWEDVIDNDKKTYTSYIEMDPAFASGFYTHGLDAMKVTAAHELHHSIQIGNYTNRYDDDGFFYELTSTSMEEFVFDDVNDYYGYIKNYFNHPETPLEQTDGYSAATWNIFLQQRFGYNIIKRQWELMPSERALYAISESVFESGFSFSKIFNEFGIWIYFTDYRAIPGKYFEEAANYSLIKPMSTIQFSQSHSPVEISAKAVAHIFLRYAIPSAQDSLVAILSNGDISSAVNNPNTYYKTSYTLYADSINGDRFLTENYSSTFNVDNPAFWSVSEILNNLVVREDSTIISVLDISESFLFPNPFSYKLNDQISVSLNAKNGSLVELSIYSISMDLIYRSEKQITLIPQNNSLGITWNALNKFGEKLASGVYIYVIKKNDGEIVKGKFVVFK